MAPRAIEPKPEDPRVWWSRSRSRTETSVALRYAVLSCNRDLFVSAHVARPDIADAFLDRERLARDASPLPRFAVGPIDETSRGVSYHDEQSEDREARDHGVESAGEDRDDGDRDEDGVIDHGLHLSQNGMDP